MDMNPRFHPAQAVLASGEVDSLRGLLEADPGLASARSDRSHPTLLQCLVLTMPPVDSLESLIDLLAEHGADLNGPLVAACGMGNLRAIVRLLDLGANVEGDGDWSPLDEAAYWCQKDAAAILLERGAAIRNLRTASAFGDREQLTRCFDSAGALTSEAGAISWPFQPLAIPEHLRRDRDQIVTNALIYAAIWGRTEAVDELLRRGAKVNDIPAGFDYSGSALHYAALEGRREVVDQLLRVGADPTIKDTKIGKLPEDWAAHSGHNDLSEYLRHVRTQAG
jgi:ankyrin repeat protein